MSKKNEPFYNPFGGLTLKPAQVEKPAAAALPKAQPKTKVPSSDEDAMMFLSAVGEVQAVKSKEKSVVLKEPLSVSAARVANDEAEALVELAQMVSGDGEFEVVNSQTFVEGSVPGFDVNVMTKLRRGAFAIAETLDLHGQTSDQARKSLELFVGKCRTAKKRCVLIVTGRGLHSADEIPVLKQGVQEWLTRGKLARSVLAFCSAQPRDGGVGAVYVLLKKAT
jgi:DNA-nicking Smr family endonuclease